MTGFIQSHQHPRTIKTLHTCIHQDKRTHYEFLGQGLVMDSQLFAAYRSYGVERLIRIFFSSQTASLWHFHLVITLFLQALASTLHDTIHSGHAFSILFLAYNSHVTRMALR